MSLSGSGNLASGIQASVQCAIKSQGARLAVTFSQSELDTLKPSSGSDKYWMGKYAFKNYTDIRKEIIITQKFSVSILNYKRI